MSLVPVDPKSEASVVTLLQQAATWLSEAVHRGEAGEVAAVKAQIATAAEATKQLNLSKEIQLDAQEMVRRAEYALGKAIRRGQAEGTIAKRGDIGASGANGARKSRGDLLAHSKDFASGTELSGNPTLGQPGIYALTDGIEPTDFDTAIDAAKAEGNLSRANVVRKVKKQSGPTTRDQRADLIAELAAQGYSSRQMPEKVGVSEASVRQIARDFDITITADKYVARTRRINSTSVVVNTATALEGLVSGVELIDYDALDVTEVGQWATSLTDSMRVLNRFVKQIKEIAQ